MDDASAKRRAKSVANSKAGVSELLIWCAKQHATPQELHAILEGTGVYHEQAALALTDAGVTVSIVNPAHVKDFGRGLGVRTKTDGVDSLVLARREAIAQDLMRERNRLDKADATETPSLIRESIIESITFLEKQLAKLQRDVDDHINKHPNLKADRDLLVSIPAVGPQVGNHLLAVMHNHQFQSAEQLTAYLGLVPVERQSGPGRLASVPFYTWP